MFQAEVTPCTCLTVNVLRGKNITKGAWNDFFDTPDPYVKIYVNEAPGARRETRIINNTKNPEWNETFTYLLPHDLSGITAEITLLDSNYTFDGTLGSIKFDLASLHVGKSVTKTFDFNKGAQVAIEFRTEIRRETDLRLNPHLCDKEESFRKIRKQTIFKSIRELLQMRGKQDRIHTADEVPVIGVLGSGGGYRAMVGYAGVMKALHDTGILDCSMYVNGLSGSSWYLAVLYANENFPKNGLKDTNSDIRSKIERNPVWRFLTNFLSYRKAVISKRKAGQPVSYTDIFGMIVGSTLLGDKMDTTNLSHFEEKMKDGNAPMPILTAVHVRPKEKAKSFHDWIEFSPYEIGIAKYGSFMDTKQFGTKFFRGVLAKSFEESPLHYLMGIWGSAFSILFKEYLESRSKKGVLSYLLKPILGDDEASSTGPGISPLRDLTETIGTESAHLHLQMENSLKMLREVPLEFFDDDDETDEEANANLPLPPNVPKKEEFIPDILIGGGDGDDSDNEENTEVESTNIGGISGWVLEKMFGVDNLQTRGQRTAKVFNYLRDISFAAPEKTLGVEVERAFDNINERLEVSRKKVYVADAGLAFNSPYPPMLRAERGVDIILSFDFSAREKDDMDPLQELYLAERWANLSGLPFPKISRDTYKKEGLKECYVFRDEENEKAPIVIHFVLCNINFRKYSAPGVPRQERDDWGNFEIFPTEKANAEKNPYSTFNFQYTNEQFDKLFQLMEYNTLLHVNTIIEQILFRLGRRRS
ncbi:cytosolic phospholipase A2-like [Clavelina lepadiformis]|uniref:cytosolic phospholipase A2-like n=1 Tax=Clavelina lepadiformis TaxID=159417 RepID=UPI0040414B0C